MYVDVKVQVNMCLNFDVSVFNVPGSGIIPFPYGSSHLFLIDYNLRPGQLMNCFDTDGVFFEFCIWCKYVVWFLVIVFLKMFDKRVLKFAFSMWNATTIVIT